VAPDSVSAKSVVPNVLKLTELVHSSWSMVVGDEILLHDFKNYVAIFRY